MSESLQSSFKTSQPLILYHFAFDYSPSQFTQKVVNKQNQTNVQTKNQMVIIDITEDKSEEKFVEIQGKQSPVNNSTQSFQKSKRNSFLSNLLLDNKFTTMANQAFLSYIFNIQKYDCQSYLKEYIPSDSNKQSYLTILRVNILQQLEEVGKVKLDGIIQKLNQSSKDDFQDKMKQIRQQLKLIRHKVTTEEVQQNHLGQRYKLLQRGILHYDYLRPATTSQKKKIKEDREIIKQQQEEFMNMHSQIIEQQMNQILRGQVQTRNKLSKQETLQKRKQIRQKLVKYTQNDPNIMSIKFRLPSGKSIILNVSLKQKVAYLFDYIQSHQTQNMGFQEQQNTGFCQRVFNIIRLEDRTALQQRTQNTLQQVFEGSLMETLIIKQK